ncbi:MAG TPA: DUF4159 domain-containing protein [Candidatus Acidoferrum sp.]|nr:DUF4159 domain-containing protein [Candidatus Acidoferrum sp.]
MKTRLLPMLLAAFLLVLPAAAQQEQDHMDPNMKPEAEFHMARMFYHDGGAANRGRYGLRRGWWAIDYPDAEIHFHGGVTRLTNINMAEDSHHIDLMNPALFDHPWLFAQQIGQGNWSPTDEEAARLREYLFRGGFLVIDDFHNEGQWQIMLKAMDKVLPGMPIVTLGPERDEIFHALYDLDALTQIPGRRHLYRDADGTIKARLEGPQRWAGVYDKKGRLMVVMNFNMDMGDAWEHADDPVYPEPMTALAYRFGINYVVYAMTH